jgi:hypothetical protein
MLFPDSTCKHISSIRLNPGFWLVPGRQLHIRDANEVQRSPKVEDTLDFMNKTICHWAPLIYYMFMSSLSDLRSDFAVCRGVCHSNEQCDC